MTGAVLLMVSLLFCAASIESLVAEWQGLRQTFRGWPAMLDPAGGQSSTALALSTEWAIQQREPGTCLRKT